MEMSSRSERRKRESVSDWKGSRLGWPKVGAIGLGSAVIGALGYSLISSSFTNDASWSTSVLNPDIQFSAQKFPESWSDGEALPVQDDSYSPRNPAPAFQDSCSFTRSISYLESRFSGRGDEYLSQYLAFSFPGVPEGAESRDMELIVDGEPFRAFSLHWGQGSVLARAFDKNVHEAPDDMRSAPPRSFGTELDRGIPGVVVAYTCQDGSDYSSQTANDLLASTEILTGR